jgi:hypothetical protein
MLKNIRSGGTMKLQTRYTFIGLIVLIALIINIALPTTAFADEAPPPPPAPAGSEPQTSATTTNISTILSTASSTGTDVVVVNRRGHKVALASQEAAKVVATNDPIWCPSGVAPIPGMGGCTATQSKFNSGLLPLINNETVSGTIWIESSYAGDTLLEGGPVALDAVTLGTTANFDLIINGGWTGTSSGFLNLSSPSIFNVPLSITNWNADVTINDITIDGTTSNGLTVNTTGNININNVKSNNNALDGALLGSSSSPTGGSIQVTDSEFNYNNQSDPSLYTYPANRAGLQAYAAGNVTLNNVTADQNNADGVLLGGFLGDEVKGNILITGGDFSSNGWLGLEFYADGAITLDNNVTANGNNNGTNYGNAYLSNVTPASKNLDISVSDSTFNGSNGDGLRVYSYGNVTLNNVTADDNDYDGAILGDANFGSPIGGDINVHGGDFSYNWGDGYSWNPAGLEAYAAGNITLDIGVTADSNYNGSGAYLDNTYGSDVPGNISISNSTFGDSSGTNGNGVNGLETYSKGNIALSTVTADYNGAAGANLDNCLFDEGAGGCTGTGVIGINNSNFNDNGGNCFDCDSWDGLDASSNGKITLMDVTANDNAIEGAHLDNSRGTGGIEVDNSTFNGNGICGFHCFWTQFGLDAYSNGDIILTNVTADGNFMDGAYLDNSYGIGGIEVDNGTFNGNGSCAYSCTDSIFFPTNGLNASSNSEITLTDVTANGNFMDGAYLDNSYSTGSMNIEVDNSIFNGNGDNGLEAYSNGDITLDNTDAIGNIEGDGAYIDPPGVVTIKCGHYDTNGGAGINDEGSTSLHLNNPELSGNGNGPYTYAGTAIIGIDCDGTSAPSGSSSGGSHNTSDNIIPITGLPIHTIDVTGGEGNGLDCTQYGGTQLILPDRDSALFPCPISDSASLSASTSDKVPGTLPASDTFVSGFTTSVIKNGASSSPVENPITVSFSVPDNMKNAKLAILYWDGSKWVEVSGHMSPDGHFEATTNLTGTFVLVSK